MNTETLEYKGYKITVAQDECAENPFESWDCEPPLLTYYGGRHGDFTSYKGPESIGDIVRLMPDACFARGQRVALIKAMLNCSMREFAECRRDFGYSDGDVKETFYRLATEQVGSKPYGWRDAIAWFELAESLLTWAGIPCLNTQSNGYSQGDSTLCLAIATPEWVQLVGAPADSLKSQLEGTIDLYSAWAWGDVYGVSEITAPGPLDEDGDETDDEEIENASCRGFYGSDHEKSGLMDHARSAIDYHIEQQAKEAASMLSAFAF